jgi:hypothetical protein
MMLLRTFRQISLINLAPLLNQFLHLFRHLHRRSFVQNEVVSDSTRLMILLRTFRQISLINLAPLLNQFLHLFRHLHRRSFVQNEVVSDSTKIK